MAAVRMAVALERLADLGLYCTPRMLRHYESLYGLDIPRTEGGQRLYTEELVEKLRIISVLTKFKLPKAFIRDVISEDLTPAYAEQLDELIEMLMFIRDKLRRRSGMA